jgi:hypothetical protein
MIKRDISNLKGKYDKSRHHAWAGSVLLTVLLAVRLFLQGANINVNNLVILIIGIFLIFYIFISVIFTYRYRSCLSPKRNEKLQNYLHTIDSNKRIKDEDINKEKLKLEKKKIKTKAKIKKKSIKK